jgi:hypothetical protein
MPDTDNITSVDGCQGNICNQLSAISRQNKKYEIPTKTKIPRSPASLRSGGIQQIISTKSKYQIKDES